MPSLRGGRRGNLRVVVNVLIPRRLSETQRELLGQSERHAHRGEPALRGVDAREATPRFAPPGGVSGSATSQAGRVIRLALRVRRSDAELVLADLLELAPSGVEEIELPADDGGEGMVEYAVYGAPGELPLLPDVQAAAGGALVEISTSEVADDWSERWKQFHQPVLIEARAADAPRARGGHCPFVRPPMGGAERSRRCA